MEIRVFKAQPTVYPVVSVTIIIDAEVPDFLSLENAEGCYEADAVTLCRTLKNSLPGGTFDHLLVEMMKEKVSLFKVSYSERE